MDANYCDYSSQNCEACIPCITLFNRLPATDARNCARSEDDCGVCLPGYGINLLVIPGYTMLIEN